MTFQVYSVNPSVMKFYIRTFGCQMNVHDSDRIAALLSSEGYQMSDTPGEADIIVINTCTVREKAWHKAVSEAGRMGLFKRRRPETILVLAGCVAEQEKERLFTPVPSVDIVVGPDHYGRLPDLIEQALSRAGHHQVLTGFDSGAPGDFLGSYPGGGDHAATRFLTIMKGCSQRCTYCIVPSVRGPERFRDVGGILRDAESLVAAGAKELVLLGQKVNGYKKQGVSFPDLLAKLDQIPGLRRLRFTSPHPRHMTDDLIQAFADLDTLCESIHLPVQSGANSVLARMKRRYTREAYIEAALKLKSVSPGFQLSTDIIVGFPGETESDFAETLELYETVRFGGAFSFKYSPRPGTVAAETMPDDVPEEEKSRRLHALHDVITRIEKETRDALIGQVHEMLVEGPARGEGQMTGRLRNNQIVNVPIPKDGIIEEWIGEEVAITVTKAFPHSLEGTLERG